MTARYCTARTGFAVGAHQAFNGFSKVLWSLRMATCSIMRLGVQKCSFLQVQHCFPVKPFSVLSWLIGCCSTCFVGTVLVKRCLSAPRSFRGGGYRRSGVVLHNPFCNLISGKPVLCIILIDLDVNGIFLSLGRANDLASVL